MNIKELKQYKRDALLGALGADVSAWDFVLSHGSGNAALCIWMLVNAVWAGNQAKNVNGEERNRMGFDSQSPKEETI